MTTGHGHQHQRVMALFEGADADDAAVEATMRSAGFIVERCQSMQQLCESAERGVGALLIAESHLHAEGSQLTALLERQPSGSDIPTIVISSDAGRSSTGDDHQRLLEYFQRGETVLFVPWPVRRDVLLLAARSALAARLRQYEVIDLQQQRDTADRALRECEEHFDRALEAGELGQPHRQRGHTECIASMGTLAAGLGHDLGNLVFPLRIRVELMRSRDTGPELQDDLNAIHNAVQYLQRLANGLRHMAMDPSEAGIGIESVDLGEWWADVEPVLRNTLARGIKLERQFDSNLPRAAVGAHGLTQAVFNLVQNAGEALMQRGAGRVVITAEHGRNNTVRLSVCDDGPGMSERVRRRCLEPFFTTKVRGISTGLGLALAHGVVSRAGGTIELTSEVGAGTTWTLTFPAVNMGSTSTRAGQQKCAAVSLNDARLSAFVVAMLRTLNFRTVVMQGSIDPPHDASVWVTDGRSSMPDAAVDFVSSDPSRFVVLLRSDGEAPEHPRILHSNGLTTSEAIRKVLRELVQGRVTQDSAA